MNRRNPHGDAASISPEKLRSIRRLLGMTQKGLGNALGITKTEVYRKETSPDHSEHRPTTKVQILALRWLLHLAGFSDAQIAKITGKTQ